MKTLVEAYRFMEYRVLKAGAIEGQTKEEGDTILMAPVRAAHYIDRGILEDPKAPKEESKSKRKSKKSTAEVETELLENPVEETNE